METQEVKTTFRLSNGNVNVKRNSLMNNLPRKRSSLYNKMVNSIPNELKLTKLKIQLKKLNKMRLII